MGWDGEGWNGIGWDGMGPEALTKGVSLFLTRTARVMPVMMIPSWVMVMVMVMVMVSPRKGRWV